MKTFAALLDRLLYTPSRNGKLRLLADYFRTAPDPDRGWALAALTGTLDFPNAKAGAIRDLARQYGRAVFVDQEQLMRGKGRLFRDCCHLSEAGARKFVSHLIGPVCARLLEPSPAPEGSAKEEK